MKKLLANTFLVSTLALAGCQTTTAQMSNTQIEKATGKSYTFTNSSYNRWVDSCGSKYKRLPNNSFQFVVDKGDVGPCPPDKHPTLEGDAPFSERAEVNTDNMRLPNGNYVWSATIDIDRPCEPAQRNEIFQIHEGGTKGAPPSQLGIEKKLATYTNGTFKTNQVNRTPVQVPNRPFDVVAEITIMSKFLQVNYYIDGEYFRTTVAPRERTGKIYIKFGTYRINSNCTIKTTYTNVSFVKVK